MKRIPKKYKGHGLHVFCNKQGCKKSISSEEARCSNKDVSAEYCPFSSHHVFQSRIWNPITKRTDGIRSYRTESFEEALELHHEFKRELKENNYNVIGSLPEKEKPVFIKDCLASYIDYLQDIGVPEHERKNRNLDYIKTQIRCISRFFDVLSMNTGGLGRVRYNAVGEETVGQFHSWLQQQGFSNASYNHHINACRFFYDYIIKRLGHEEFKNPFKYVKKKYVATNPQIILEEDFEILLSVITEENGIGTKSGGGRIQYYRPWIKDVFVMGLLIGERLDGLVQLKWKNVKTNYIDIPNWKVNRLQNTDINKSHTPITTDLARLLMRLGLSEQLGSDNYILVPEWENRSSLKNFITKAFTHYWRVTGITKNISFKHLRKTYITRMFHLLGERAKSIKHTNDDTVLRHYLYEKQITRKLTDKSLFNLDYLK